MPSLSAISFAIATTLAGYLASACATPPNPTPPSSSQIWPKDSLHLFNRQPIFILMNRLILFVVCLHHAILALVLDSTATLEHGQLNPDLFRWTPAYSLGLVSIYMGAALRLSAYGALGSRFTFSLTKPNELNTRGIYAYMQHPSYTGGLFVVIPHLLLFGRWDGWPAYWMPSRIFEASRGWGFVSWAVVMALLLISLRVRVLEEEAMLKEVFGSKWVAWHKRTKRFVPGIF